jgi:hypothetical protein
MLFMVCTTASAAEASYSDASFVGCWFGTGTQGLPERTVQSLNHRHDDGTYDIRFVSLRLDEPFAYSQENGYWAVNGSRYLTISAAVDGEPAVNAEVYDILHTGPDALSYRDVGSGNLFKSERVPCDTRLPRRDMSP